jgi:hypothetical protein
VPERVAEQRVVAALARIAEAGALLLIALHLADERVDVDHQPLGAGPAPAAQARAIESASTRSSRRTCPNVNERRKVPSVEGAIARWPSSAAVPPARSTSQPAIESAPSAIACSSEQILRPGLAAPGRSPSATVRSTSRSIPSRSISVPVNATPALATSRSSSNTTASESPRTTGSEPFTMSVTS